MLYKPSIHPLSLLAKNLLGRFEKMRGGLRYGKDELIVVNYHSTPKKFLANFKEQVNFLKSNFEVIGPDDLQAYYAGEATGEKCRLLFTFDDGLKNNLHAAEVLNKAGIKALFFIVPGFIDTPVADQKAFYLRNIRPQINPAIDGEDEDLSAMNWEELKGLVRQGHALGAHTLTHSLVAQSSSSENSQKEIVACQKVIEQRTGIKVNSFCSINDTLQSTGKKEKDLIASAYTYHFTTLPGYNAVNKNKFFIKRRNVECHWPDGAFFYALGQADLGRWAKKIEAYNNL